MLCACADARDDEDGPGDTGIGVAEGIPGDSVDGGDEAAKLDVAGGASDGAMCAEGACGECTIPEHTPCDADSADPFHAMGLNCPGAPAITATTDGSPTAIGTRFDFGNTDTWQPREGSKFAVIGSGPVADLDLPTPPGDDDAMPTHCDDDLGNFDPGPVLPVPLRVNDVAGDCITDATLLGTGDCSRTIQGQFSQGLIANDYTELRIEATVPPTTNSIAYDFAFFSTEYPFYYNDVFNDMYIGWLESESWTGNISFDTMGNPISLNAGFLDFRDDGADLPELAGTCMRQHAGTRWLSSVAPVTPGESITVVFAVFDLADSILDSYVFLDNFQWGCEGTDHPMTKPVG